MDAISMGGCRELDFDDFDSLAESLDNAALELDAFEHALSDDLGPYRRQRVISYAGSPGAFVSCPHCGIGGKRVDGTGAYFCESCGFTNTEDRPPPDHRDDSDRERDGTSISNAPQQQKWSCRR